MSIDIHTESMIRVFESPKVFPGNPSPQTVRRWRNRGIRGIKLEVIMIGGVAWTSREACDRFLRAINAPQPTAPKLTVGQHKRSAASAMQALAGMGAASS